MRQPTKIANYVLTPLEAVKELWR